MKFLLIALASFAFVTVLAALPASQMFVGKITDDMCPMADHSHMQMGPTDAECTKACIEYHGSMYALYDGKNTYVLSDQRTPEKFAGQKVKVTGVLNAKNHTIQVDSIVPAN